MAHSHPPKVALLVELLPLPASPTTGSGLAYQPLLVATTHLACGEELEEQRLAQADWASTGRWAIQDTNHN